MNKINSGIDKEKIINIDKFELYLPLIECVVCKKISFPPYECLSCSRCICKNCGDKCPLCNKKLTYYPNNIKQIYKGFKIKDEKNNNIINISKYEKELEEKINTLSNIEINKKKKNNLNESNSSEEESSDEIKEIEENENYENNENDIKSENSIQKKKKKKKKKYIKEKNISEYDKDEEIESLKYRVSKLEQIVIDMQLQINNLKKSKK